MTVGNVFQKFDALRERQKRSMNSMKLEVSGKSVQVERKDIAQVLRAWETSADFQAGQHWLQL